MSKYEQLQGQLAQANNALRHLMIGATSLAQARNDAYHIPKAEAAYKRLEGCWDSLNMAHKVLQEIAKNLQTEVERHAPGRS